MKAREYERRRRALDEQLHADLNLIRAGYDAKLRALEIIWLASDEADAVSSETVHQETIPSEMVQSETVLSETVPTEMPDQAPAREVQRGDVLSDFLAALPDLPEVFEKKDVYQALGYVPPRATLYRVIWRLKEDKKIAIARHSEGRIRTQYRKLG